MATVAGSDIELENAGSTSEEEDDEEKGTREVAEEENIKQGMYSGQYILVPVVVEYDMIYTILMPKGHIPPSRAVGYSSGWVAEIERENGHKKVSTCQYGYVGMCAHHMYYSVCVVV